MKFRCRLTDVQTRRSVLRTFLTFQFSNCRAHPFPIPIHFAPQISFPTQIRANIGNRLPIGCATELSTDNCPPTPRNQYNRDRKSREARASFGCSPPDTYLLAKSRESIEGITQNTPFSKGAVGPKL